MSVPDFDFIIAGGGLAGLSLACHLAHSPLRGRRVLVVEREGRTRADRTWCYWSRAPGLFDRVATRTWRQLRVSAPGYDAVVELGSYAYHMLRGLDFYEFAQHTLARTPHMTWLRGEVQAIESSATGARVTVDGRDFHGRWVFDSRPPAPAAAPLHMRFRGWEVAAPGPAFDPGVATFLDFRTAHREDVRFFYVLPLDARRALVEYTAFTRARLGRAEAEAALREYLARAWGVRDYDVTREEAGSLPLLAEAPARQLGPRVMAIGVRGGRLKPTTGFAFERIQADSAAIVRSLLANGRPWDGPATPARFGYYDRLMLGVMAGHGAEIAAIFGALFRRNPAERVLAFLDEQTAPLQEAALIATLPPRRFLEQVAATLRPARPRLTRRPRLA